ncbi:hypothetical protein BU26DRAFT_157549 [Trematosphaeria pertusa]|uniref:Protein kinase domain-containing protein n=1 Tax=Trematosphaeria pertusa TaxID=390896 RepID=A0A6A6HVP0_9PLEO|nr:uncharacterized protein BU26DRAFT_157549 [Trematosphaeria pertusa]KAF2242254.1 hypothetical protein BU26DRAFT_157549 [Trematosphaeria pertusa]
MAAALVGLIGLGLAAPGVINVFLQAGNYVAGRLEENKKAKEFATNLRTFYIADEVDVLRLHMKSAHAIVTDPRTEPFEKTRLNNHFEEIKSLLQSINEFTNVVLSTEWDLRFKRRSALAELRKSTARCKDCIENFRDRVRALRDIHYSESDLLLRPLDFNWVLSEADPITLSASALVRLGRTTREIRGTPPMSRRFFYETIPYTKSTKLAIQQNLEVVVQKLAMGGSGVLPLLGFRDDDAEEQFQIIFVLPQREAYPSTLSSLIREIEVVPSLNVRVNICVQLAEAALYLHSVGLVHKGIRPDNIAVLPNENGDIFDADDKVVVFLFGFDVSRPIDQYNTAHAGELLWQRRIYQHPQRQKRVADADYNMGHDIYSLGACALEILRWSSFVRLQINRYGEEEYTLSPEFLTIYRKFKEGAGESRDRESSDMAIVMSDPKRVQRILTTCCKNEVSRLAGRKLANIVSDCLKMVDVEAELGAEGLFKAEDPTNVGTQFVDRVLVQFREVANAI